MERQGDGVGPQLQGNDAGRQLYRCRADRYCGPGGRGEIDYFLSNLPQDAFGALRKQIGKKFGVEVSRVLTEMNALILTVQNRNAPGLKPSAKPGKGSLMQTDKAFTATHLDGMWVLRQYLEEHLGTIVVDQTKLPGDLDVDLTWDATPEGLKAGAARPAWPRIGRQRRTGAGLLTVVKKRLPPPGKPIP